MNRTDTVVIGAGHAGLAVSRLLTDVGRHHVVLDRGRIGERWRSERWDSLRLLSPNWMTRLPGWDFRGPDPEGFMSAAELVRYLERYAASFAAPVVGETTVEEVSATASGRERYRVVTDRGTWLARHVVIATGPHGVPHVPDGLDPATALPATGYRNPAQLPTGGVLVVGASSSGVQIADELARAGRDVVLAVGRHTRMPRRYRGMDVYWWLESTGRLAQTIDGMPDATAARNEPSMQLVGRNGAGGRDLDLRGLQARGIRLVGRLDAVVDGTAQLRTDLAGNVAAADARLHRFLDSLDEYAESAGLVPEILPATRPRPVHVPAVPDRLDLRAHGIGSVILAAGYCPHYPWLRLPITAPDGNVRQHRGVTPAPGVYVVGQRFQHRRDSGFIDGARHDARTVVRHMLTGSVDTTSGLAQESAA